MAEFHFFASANDVEGIFASLSERGDLRFIPARSYPTDQYISLKGVRTETERALSQNRCWYITGSFTKEPVYMQKIADSHFSIGEQYDGPVISLRMPPLNRIEDGKHRFVNGNLSHPREYWDRQITSARRVPLDVKSAYADIIKTIKLHLLRRKFGKNIWIGRSASKMIDDEKALIRINGHWWDGKGNHFFKPDILGQS